ncbi:MAG: hypothetical protein K5876_00895, partial [Ruminiclostridium sp.]|nr:hypothetical protein [Ruminiclostridium sp.]
MNFSPLELFRKARRNTLPEQIWACVAAALTATFYFYEYQFESVLHIRTPLLLCMAAAIFVIWTICSFSSGRSEQFGFAIFTFIYWGFPFIYTLYYSGRDNLKHYNKWLSMLNKSMTAVLCNPFSEAAAKVHTTPQTIASALVFISMMSYIGGLLLGRYFDSKAQKGSVTGTQDVTVSSEKPETAPVPEREPGAIPAFISALKLKFFSKQEPEPEAESEPEPK